MQHANPFCSILRLLETIHDCGSRNVVDVVATKLTLHNRRETDAGAFSFKRRQYEICGRYLQTVTSQWYIESCLLLTPFGPEEAR